jgi:hypothetical protein
MNLMFVYYKERVWPSLPSLVFKVYFFFLHNRCEVHVALNDYMVDAYGAVGGMRIDEGNENLERTCSSATLLTINPTSPDWGWSPGCCCLKLMINFPDP